MDVVSSYRTKGYCDHLFSFGVRPTLLTHRWDKTDNGFQRHGRQDAVTIEETEHCTIIRLPYPGRRRSRSVLQTFWSYVTGNLDVEILESYKIFKRYLLDHLQHNSYDVLIAIYNP